MGYVTGVCCYCQQEAQSIPNLKHIRGLLYTADGKVHCFRKANSQKQKDVVVVSKQKEVVGLVPEPESETKAEAQALWESAFEKQCARVDGRIAGTVCMWSENEDYGYLRSDDDGTEFYVHRSDVAADEYNRRFLILDESVLFRLKKGRSAKHFDLTAAFVTPKPRVDLNISAAVDWREEMIVMEFDPINGEGRLSQISDPTARWIFFTRDAVITEGSIYPGVRVWCGFRRTSDRRKGFQAFDLEIIKGETQ